MSHELCPAKNSRHAVLCRRFWRSLCQAARPVALLLALGGCGNSAFLQVVDGMSSILPSLNDKPVDRTAIDATPYASIAARVGSAPWAIMILGKVDGDTLYWYAQDKGVIVTRHGRVVRTIGFPRDLEGSRAFGHDPLDGPARRETTPVASRHRIDIWHGGVFGSVLEAEMRFDGEEVIEWAGQRLSTYRYVETAHSPGLDWKVTNVYWRTPNDGMVMRSRQHYVPGYPPIMIEAGKPFVR